jgi:hypothetical protein
MAAAACSKTSFGNIEGPALKLCINIIGADGLKPSSVKFKMQMY